MGQPGPHQKMWLTVDFREDVRRLGRFAHDFGSQMPTTKLGPEFLTYPLHHKQHIDLRAHGIKTALDSKQVHNAQQMGPLVERAEELRFSYTTVYAGVGATGLICAGLAQKEIQVVAAISTVDKVIGRREIEMIRAANAELPIGRRIGYVMCNVADVTAVKSLPDVKILATGIRMPDDPSHDQPSVATPADALKAGADVVAVGRSITHADDHVAAFQRVLDNIASVS